MKKKKQRIEIIYNGDQYRLGDDLYLDECNLINPPGKNVSLDGMYICLGGWFKVENNRIVEVGDDKIYFVQKDMQYRKRLLVSTTITIEVKDTSYRCR